MSWSFSTQWTEILEKEQVEKVLGSWNLNADVLFNIYRPYKRYKQLDFQFLLLNILLQLLCDQLKLRYQRPVPLHTDMRPIFLR